MRPAEHRLSMAANDCHPHACLCCQHSPRRCLDCQWRTAGAWHAATAPPDRFRAALQMFGGAVGAYTDSRGNAGVRQEVADFIQRRDGYPSDPEHIFLTGAAAAGWLASWALAVPCHGLLRAQATSRPDGCASLLRREPPWRRMSHGTARLLPLADGASVAVRLLLNALIRDANDHILVPIPQARCGGRCAT